MAGHDKTIRTGILVRAYDRIHPDDWQTVIDAYERHENADTFVTAPSTVVKNVRILDRQAMRYEVARRHMKAELPLRARTQGVPVVV